MKTAIVCDWLVTYSGAEQVLEQIIQCFPDADIFTVIDFMPAQHREFLKNKSITTTFIQKMPWAKKYYRAYFPLMPLAIEQLDLSGYDLVISSSHAVAKGIITGPDQIHVSYVHTPMRYAWDMQHQYLHKTKLDKGILGFITKYALHRLRIWDQRTANNVDHFIANSHFIARRILKTYRRPSTVIYPSIDTTLFTPRHHKENFYLTASRMVPYKKIDLIIDSFARMPEKKLVVIGDGPNFQKIKKITVPNIEILGYQPTPVLIDYMQRAKAFIFAAEEDFGIVLLEAQACGTPVIAYQRGGAIETVRGMTQEKPTGIFFNEQSIPAIQKSIEDFETHQHRLLPQNCIDQASQFKPEYFQKNFKAAILEAMMTAKTQQK